MTTSNNDPQQHPLRVVSLLASITEILAALGLSSEEIVGVTHCCDYPPSLLQVPCDTASQRSAPAIVTNSDIRPALMSQEEIHERVTSALRKGDSLYALNEGILKELQPTLTHIFTQSLCDICAVSAPLVQSTCARIFSSNENDSVQIISLEPHTLDDVWETIRIAGRVLDRNGQAERVVSSCLKDLNLIQTAVETHCKSQQHETKKKPRVAFLEWHDPFISGGHWIADMLEIAGGEYTLNKSGSPSAVVQYRELLDYDPDVILIGPCGFDTKRAVKDTLPLLHQSRQEVTSCWKQLRAVQSDQVFALDANSYFARPGPRLVQGVGLLAKCIHPALEEESAIPDRLAPCTGMCQITMDMYLPCTTTEL